MCIFSFEIDFFNISQLFNCILVRKTTVISEQTDEKSANETHKNKHFKMLLSALFNIEKAQSLGKL